MLDPPGLGSSPAVPQPRHQRISSPGQQRDPGRAPGCPRGAEPGHPGQLLRVPAGSTWPGQRRPRLAPPRDASGRSQMAQPPRPGACPVSPPRGHVRRGAARLRRRRTTRCPTPQPRCSRGSRPGARPPSSSAVHDPVPSAGARPVPTAAPHLGVPEDADTPLHAASRPGSAPAAAAALRPALCRPRPAPRGGRRARVAPAAGQHQVPPGGAPRSPCLREPRARAEPLRRREPRRRTPRGETTAQLVEQERDLRLGPLP